MEHLVLPGHSLDHSSSTCCRTESPGLTEQAQSNAPELPQVLGLAPVAASVPAEESRCVSRRTLALKRKAKAVQVPTSESSVPVQPCPHPAPPSSCPPAPGSPLLIHGYTVQEYQSIYHSVVDPMLMFPSGRPRPYSLALGRKIKQRLWEKLNRPLITELETSGGLLHYVESSSTGPYPPLIDVDVSKEPPPPKPSVPFVFQAQPSVSSEAGPTQPQRDLLREQAVGCAEPASQGSLRHGLKRKKTRGFQASVGELPDQTSSSAVPEAEEPRSKRLYHPAAKPEHPEEPRSSRRFVLKFTRQDTHSRRPVYTVEDVSEQVSPRSPQTSARAPDFLLALGLAPKRPAAADFSEPRSPQPTAKRHKSY